MSKLEAKDLEEIYIHTKNIDKIFEKRYDIRSKEIIHKYILELLVELSELANETRCFKFWSSKSSSSKHIVLEEYTDCLFMIMYFCNITNIELNEDFDDVKYDDIISCFIDLYRKTCILEEKLDKEIVKQLLVRILYLGDFLDFDINDLKKGTLIKEEKIQRRFEAKDYL